MSCFIFETCFVIGKKKKEHNYLTLQMCQVSSKSEIGSLRLFLISEKFICYLYKSISYYRYRDKGEIFIFVIIYIQIPPTVKKQIYSENGSIL